METKLERDIISDRWGSYNDGDFYPIFDKANKTPGVICKSLRHVGVELEVIPDYSYSHQDFYTEFFKLDERSGSSLDGGGIELQTPPLAGKALEDYLKKVGDIFEKYKFSAKNSCGAHIHIDMNKGFIKSGTPLYAKIAGVVRLYAIVERWMKLSLPKHRQNSIWSKNIAGVAKSTEFLNIFKTKDSNEQYELLQDCWNWGNTKVNGLNIQYAVDGDDDKGTDNIHIEVRYHQGTVDMKDMIYWSALNTSLVDFVDKNFGKEPYNRCIKIGERHGWDKVPRLLHQELKIPKSIIRYFSNQIKKNNPELT